MQNGQLGRDCRDCSWEDIEEGRCDDDCPLDIPELLDELQHTVWRGTGHKEQVADDREGGDCS